MAHAPHTNDQHKANPDEFPAIRGFFREYANGTAFEWGDRLATDCGGQWQDHPHRVYTADGFRVAKVLKTVAYVVIDENADGSAVVERWGTKGARAYSLP